MRRPCPAPSLIVAAAALLAALRPAPAAPGDLDSSFNGTGWMYLPQTRHARGLAVQPDGRILISTDVVGDTGSYHLGVSRYLPDGSLDLSFNGTGRVRVAEERSFGSAILLRPGGHIFAAGIRHVPDPTFAYSIIAALLPDGQRDTSLFQVQDNLLSTPNSSIDTHGLAIQPDGKILIAAESDRTQTFVRRWTPDGLPDPSFGDAGVKYLPVIAGTRGVNALALQSDGRIVIARVSSSGELTRLLPDGTLDATFGNPSTATSSLPVTAKWKALTVLSDGKILAAGTGDLPGFMVARYLPDGKPDPAFGDAGTPGRVLLPLSPGSGLGAMCVQNDGRIITAGTEEDPPGPDGPPGDIALARFTPDGVPDATFGTDGLAHADLGGSEGALFAALAADDKLIIAGFQNSEKAVLARFDVPASTSLSVEYPNGTSLPPWSPPPVNFGPVTAGSRLIQIILRNTGLAPLTDLQASLTDQSIPGDYQLTPFSAATLAPGDTATVIITLTPSAAPGLRTATLRLTSGNTSLLLPPRLIPLTGSKATPQEIWRVTWFGNPDNSGPGADAADFDGDGLSNLMEYALRTSPHASTPPPCQPEPGTPGAFTYTRPAAAILTEFSWQPEAAAFLAGPWSPVGLTSTVLTDDGTVQTVLVEMDNTAAPQMFLRLRVTKL